MSHPGQRRVADERGFTIVEVLIAAVIITLALVALATIVPIGVYGVQEGNQTSAATFLADQKLEQAKSLPWTSVPGNDCLGLSASSTVAPTVPAGTTCTFGATAIPGGGAVTWLADETLASPFAGYSRNVRITNCGSAPGCGGITDPGMRLVTVTVFYTPMTGTGVAPTPKAVTVWMTVAQR